MAYEINFIRGYKHQKTLQMKQEGTASAERMANNLFIRTNEAGIR